MSEDRLCIWDSTVTQSRNGSENGPETDAIMLGTSQLKSAIPKSETSRCKNNTDDYGPSAPRAAPKERRLHGSTLRRYP
ncbi:hypothetical protein [Streptomyces sp. NPDC087300]|uniref:hypothetical protein n=1 Tax=Streptomyces sp. NPDC087300 TaxID=3365780 RepID=UPI0038094909